MAIITHERPLIAEEGANQTATGEQATRTRFTYDPDKLSTLTAGTMNDIEDAILAAEEQGAEPEELHKLVASRLEEIGIDPQTVAGDAIVVRMEGVGGKQDVRAIVISPEDFGTRIHGAELVPEQAEAAEPEEEKQRAEQEAKDQDHALEVILADIGGDLRGVERLIADNTELERQRVEFVDHTRQLLEILASSLREGVPMPPSELALFVEQGLKDMWDTLRKDAARHNEEQKMATQLSEELTMLRQQTNRLDAAHQAQLEGAVKQVRGRVEEVTTNRTQIAGASEQASLAAEQAFGIASEMLYSANGREAYGEDLKRIAADLEVAINDSRMLQKTYTGVSLN